jgi:hypothetical protein
MRPVIFFARCRVAIFAALILAGYASAQTGAGNKVESEKSFKTLSDNRILTAKQSYDQLFDSHRRGIRGLPLPESVYQWSRRWLDAEIEASGNAADQIAAYQRHLDRMKQLEERVRNMVEKANSWHGMVASANYFRAEAEFWLARALRSLQP